jgi:hypothetical protein
MTDDRTQHDKSGEAARELERNGDPEPSRNG